MEKATSFIETTAKALASAWVVTKIYDAAAATVQFADEMHNLSIQTGIGVVALQELEYAARRTNTPFETITKAINVLQEKLATGDKSAVAALHDMGVSFDEIKAKRPEEQFRAILHAVEAIESPMDRVAILGATFGDKLGPQLLPLASSIDELTQHFRDLGVVLDQDTITNLSSLDGTMVDLEYIGRAVMANVLVPLVPYLKDAASASSHWKDVLDGVVLVFDSFVYAGAKVVGVAAEIAIAGLKAEKFLEPWKNFDGVLDAQIAELQQAKDWAEQWAHAVETVDRTQKSAATSTNAHDQEVRRLKLSFGAAADEAEAARARFQKVAEQWKAMWEDMHKASVKMIDSLVNDTNKAAREMADEIVRQQLKLRELLSDAKAANAALYNQGGGTSAMDSAVDANEAARKAKLNEVNSLYNLDDPNSMARMDEARRVINDTYDRMFNDIVTKAGQFGDDVAGTIAASEPKLAAASAQAAGSVQNNFLQIFGSVESRAGQMVDSVMGTLHAMQLSEAYKAAGFFVSLGPADMLNHMRVGTRTTAGMPHLAGGGIVNSPTVALIGEKGPEAVVPLDRGGFGATNIHVSIAVNGAMDGPSAAKAGQQAADAIIARMRAQGIRL